MIIKSVMFLMYIDRTAYFIFTDSYLLHCNLMRGGSESTTYLKNKLMQRKLMLLVLQLVLQLISKLSERKKNIFKNPQVQ